MKNTATSLPSYYSKKAIFLINGYDTIEEASVEAKEFIENKNIFINRSAIFASPSTYNVDCKILSATVISDTESQANLPSKYGIALLVEVKGEHYDLNKQRANVNEWINITQNKIKQLI